MKYLFTILALLSCHFFHFSQAQSNLILPQYGVLPQVNHVSPASMPKSKFNIALPGVEFLAQNNAYTINRDWLTSDDVLNEFILADINSLPDVISVGVESKVDLFSVGFRGKNDYFSFLIQMDQKGSFASPKDIFTLWQQVEDDNPQPGQTFDFSSADVNLSSRLEIGFGYSRTIAKKFNVGARLKIIKGLAYLDILENSLVLSNPSNDFNYQATGDLRAVSAGLGNIGSISDLLSSRSNSGMAVDLGIEFNPTAQLSFYASVLDIGSINWQEDVTTYEFTDFDFENDTFGEFEVASSTEGYTEKLAPKIYAGARYSLTPNHLFHASVSIDSWDENPYATGMSLGYVHQGKWAGAGLHLTKYEGLDWHPGVGIYLNPGPVQIYMLSENISGIFASEGSKEFAVRLGVNLVFGKKRYFREQYNNYSENSNPKKYWKGKGRPMKN